MADSVRIEPQAHARLVVLAQQSNASLTETLSRAIEAYETQVFWRQFYTAAAELRSDPRAWAEELAERALWDNANPDGLRDEAP